uniref:Uncharacterized protein n=1 Tax=Aegilops tauschii subsp. strangulata TaxID=200361 RepID=A0A453ARU4_AEGTS
FPTNHCPLAVPPNHFSPHRVRSRSFEELGFPVPTDGRRRRGAAPSPAPAGADRRRGAGARALGPRPDAGAGARPLRRGGSPPLPGLRGRVGHLRGHGWTDRGEPRLGRELRPLPLPRGPHVRGPQGPHLQHPCAGRASRPVDVRGLRVCTCIWIHFGIQEERPRNIHAGVGCSRSGFRAPRCLDWLRMWPSSF